MRSLQLGARSLHRLSTIPRASRISLHQPCQPYSYTRYLFTLPRLPIFKAISNHDKAFTSVVHSASGRTFTYGQLLRDVAIARVKLLDNSGNQNLAGERIGFLAENSYDYVGAEYTQKTCHSSAWCRMFTDL